MSKDALDEFTTNDYFTRVGEDVRGEDKSVLYQCVNRVTGVVEYQDYVLPRFLGTIKELQRGLDEARDEFRGKPQIKLVEDNKGESDETGGSVH